MKVKKKEKREKKMLSHSAGLHGIYHLSAVAGAGTRSRAREDALALVIRVDTEVYAGHV